MRVCFDNLCFGSSQRTAGDDEPRSLVNTGGGALTVAPTVNGDRRALNETYRDLDGIMGTPSAMNSESENCVANTMAGNDMQPLIERIRELEALLKQRDQEMLELRSQLDKLQSVFPYQQFVRASRTPRKKRAQGISAEPQTSSSLQDLAHQTFPVYDKSDASAAGKGRQRIDDHQQSSEEDRETIADARKEPPHTAPSYPIHHEVSPISPSEIVQTATEQDIKAKSASNKSDRKQRIARAKQEVAKRKLQLAEANLEVLEAEESDDDGSVLTNESGGQARVTEWLNHHTSTEIQPVQPPEKKSEPIVSAAKPEVPTVSTKREEQKIDLTELANAIAMAAKPVPGPVTSKYMAELGTFTGCHTEWLSFLATYRETAGYFTDTENTARLRRALKGRAREAVDSLLISTTRANDIIDELQTRFGRSDTIALATLEGLRNISRTTDTPKDICLFAGRVKNSIATLKALKKKYYLYNPEIVKHLTEKLTPSLRYRWFDFAKDQPIEEPDLLQFYNFVTRESNLCGRYADPENITASTRETVPLSRTVFKAKPQRTHVVSENQVRSCYICKQTGHTTAPECEEFKKATSNKRWEMAKQFRLCFRCLQYKRFSHRCKTKTCGIDNCQKTHHPLLHYAPKGEETEVVSNACTSRSTASSYLKILPVTVMGPKSIEKTYALLDDGSTVTLIDEDLARRVGAEGPVDPLNIEAIAGTRINRTESQRITLQLQGQDEQHTLRGRTIKHLKLAGQEVKNSDLQKYRHLEDIVHKIQYEEAQPSILIGQDNWELLLAHDVRRGNSEEPVASKTSLGWVLHGQMNRSLGHAVHHVYRINEVKDRLEETVKRHFAIESLGVEPRSTRADPDERALKILRDKTVKLPSCGYSTALLWKTDTIDLPNNYDQALTRLYCTEKKVDRRPELRLAYEAQMGRLLEMGYAEVAHTAPTSGRTWYLPHFPVLHPAKPGKVRPVFDAAARTRGTSLNDHLLSGPDLLQSLPGVLMRFRQYPIAVAADIQEMFLRIQINEEDRDALRFLWRPHRREGPPIEYRMKSVIFGAASSPCTALYIKNHNAEQHREKFPDAAEAIIHHHYMDDYLQSFTTIEEAVRITKEVREVHTKANFHLRKWTSNRQELLQAHQAEPVLVRDVTLEQEPEEKILGLIWRPTTDTLGFNLNFARVTTEQMDGESSPTKREALRTVMSLFDPLGLASPITVKAKQLLQEAWRLGIDWDQRLPPPLASQWHSWIRHLVQLRHVNLPRCHPGYGHATHRELHTFVDASEKAYAAAVYWRIVDEDGQVHVTLAAARARVAPLKLVSIPRLELQAAVLGSRLARTTAEEYQHKPDQRYYWSDSRTVLTWLRAGPRSFKSFVAHRVAEIEEETQASEWRWIPTQHNVADDATREVPTDFTEKHRWFTGPEFLYSPADNWPKEKLEVTDNIETGEERVHVTQQKTENKLTEALPDIKRFSSWLRLIRTTARIIQFIELIRRKKDSDIVNYKRTSRNKEKDPTWLKQKLKPNTVTSRQIERSPDTILTLEASHIRSAELLWIQSSQEDSFPEEIEKVKRNEPLTKDSRLRQLTLIYDRSSSVLKLKSRIAAAEQISEQQKNPTVLDGNHPYVRLYASWVHRTLHHGGVEIVMNELRQRFWVLRARPIIRHIVKWCQYCRLRRAKAPIPPTGDLPLCRLAHHHRPFTYTGLDYFGPLSVTVGRQHQKRYVALFTCLTTRAVHLEIAATLSTDSAILALRRMMARRGQPKEIWSDNGTNLRGTDIELRKSALQASREEAVNYSIQWRFIPPSAPFMGGAWERLVRSVKTALFTTLHERHPHEETLVTLLCEAEYTVNSRPLTHISVDADDQEALTPNHFLLGGSGRLQCPGVFTEADIASRHHWRQAQKLADHFWARWIREYLPELQNRREPYGHGAPLNVGDLVLVADSNLPRNVWPRGRVIQVYPGRDGIIRTANIGTRTGILLRPVRKLVVLPTSTVVTPEGTGALSQPSHHGGRNVHDDHS